MYRVETTANGQFDDDSNVLYTYSSGREIFWESYCEINHTSDELDAITHIRLTAIDMAGNESEPFVFEVGSYITIIGTMVTICPKVVKQIWTQ